MLREAQTSASEIALIQTLAQTNLAECYQCGKCTAGCPMASQMDVVPNRLIRLLQLGEADTALRADSIWQCVSCQTCSTRCPKSVDCAAAMDALREVSYQRDAVSPTQRRTALFQKVFLDNVRRNGRLNEIELIAAFKAAGLRAGGGRLSFLLEGATLAPQLSKRGKFHLVGEKVRDRGVVRRIFERTMDHQK